MLPAAALPWVFIQTTRPAVAHRNALAVAAPAAGEATAATAATGVSAAAQARAAAPVSRRGQNKTTCKASPFYEPVKDLCTVHRRADGNRYGQAPHPLPEAVADEAAIRPG